MAWVGTAIAGDELTWYNADKPMIIGAHAIRDSVPLSARWSATEDMAGADITATGFPAYRAYDAFIHATTKNNNSALTVVYYVVNLSAAPPVDFDMVMIGGNNLDQATTSIEVAIADDSTFTTRRTPVHVFASPADTGRLVSLRLDDLLGGGMKRYSGVDYLSIKIDSVPTFVPEITEIWLGRRRQLPRRPDYPWGDRDERTIGSELQSRGGITTFYTHARGQALRSQTTPLINTAEHDIVSAWWDESQEGSRSFLWVEEPATAPVAYVMNTPDRRLNMPRTGPFLRPWSIDMMEQAPFVSQEP